MPSPSDTNHCANSGYLVGAKSPLPTDKSEFNPPKAAYIQGCNNIVCRRCKSPVRNEPHYFPMASSAQAKEIYETQDWRTRSDLQYMVKGYEDTRTYCCSCTLTFTAEVRQLGDPDDRRVPAPWVCGGHPVRTEPVQVGDLKVGPDADFGDLVERAYGGWLPSNRAADPDGRTGIWIQDLYDGLIGTKSGPALAHAVAAQLKSPDLARVSTALRFFAVYGDADQDGTLLAMARSTAERERLRNETDPFGVSINYSTLEDKLMYALSKQVDDEVPEPQRLQLLREYALLPGRVAPVLDKVVACDYDWAMEHVVQIAGQNPDNIKNVLLQTISVLTLEAAKEIGRLPQLDAEILRTVAKDFLGMGRDKALLSGLAEREAAAPQPKP